MTAAARPSLSRQTTPAGTVVVTLDGEFDVSKAPAIGHRVSDELDASSTDVVVDMRGVTFVDSRMIGALLVATRRARLRHHALLLIRPNPNVWRVFQMTGLDRLFGSFGALRDALWQVERAGR